MARFICPDCKKPAERSGGATNRRGGTEVIRCMPCARQRQLDWPKISGAAVAHRAVNLAVKRGAMQPAWTHGCRDCGGQAMDYDHRDYNRPLDVEPVCRGCNKRRGAAIWRTQQQAA